MSINNDESGYQSDLAIQSGEEGPLMAGHRETAEAAPYGRLEFVFYVREVQENNETFF